MRGTYYKPQNGTKCTYTKLKGEFILYLLSKRSRLANVSRYSVCKWLPASRSPLKFSYYYIGLVADGII